MYGILDLYGHSGVFLYCTNEMNFLFYTNISYTNETLRIHTGGINSSDYSYLLFGIFNDVSYKCTPSIIVGSLFFFIQNSTVVLSAVLILYRGSFFKPLVSLLNRVFFEAEQNIICLEDFMVIVSMYLSYTLYFGSIYIPVSVTSVFMFRFCKLIMFLFIAIVLAVPVYFIIQSGAMVFYYIKGSSNDNSIYVSAMNDTMGLVSTILRYSVQSIRWFLFFLFYFALQLFMYEIKYVLVFSDSFDCFINQYPTLLGGFNSNLGVYLVYAVVRVWFEIVDFIFVTVVQLSAFIVVLFWLLGFLFSTKLPSMFESSYMYNRANR